VVRAGRNRLIAARYTKTRSEWQPDGDFILTTADLIGEHWDRRTTLGGELTAGERETIERRLSDRVRLLAPAFSVRRAGFLAEIAWERIRAGAIDDPAVLQPLYLAPGQQVTA